MTDKQAATDLMTLEEVARFFSCARPMASALMRRLDIPKRGRGFPAARIFLALGFDRDIDPCTPELRRPLLDVPQLAKAIGVSRRTAGRMVAGDHADTTFADALWLGARKRLVFPFEAEAWRKGLPPAYSRVLSRVHPAVTAAGYTTSTSLPRPASESETSGAMRPSGSQLFMSPRQS